MLALGLLLAAGTAFAQEFGESRYDGNPSHGNDGPNWNNNHNWNDGSKHDFGHGDKFYDWLNPGGYYTYSYYPTYAYSYYPASYYPAYYYPTYTPVYTYTAPVTPVTTPVVYSYDPIVYDPWWAVNVYGLGTTTYYSSSWSWSYYHGGLFFR